MLSWAVKIVGVAYLLWLAFKLARSTSLSQLDASQLRFGVAEQNLVDLLRAYFLSSRVRAKVDAWRFIAAGAEECDAFHEHAASERANHALLNLCAFNPLEWEAFAAHVVEIHNRCTVIDLRKLTAGGASGVGLVVKL